MDFSVKTDPPVLLMSADKRLTHAEIPEFAQTTMPRMFGKLNELGIKVIGPATFIYHYDDKGFEMNLGLPVGVDTGNPAPFRFFKTEAYKCLSCIHLGSMQTIGPAWDALMHEARKQGLTTTKESREVYQYWIAFDSAENKTELQVGVL